VIQHNTTGKAIFKYPLILPHLPSVVWHSWLGSRKGIRPVKTERWGAGVVGCLEQGADLHMAQLMPLPLTVSCFSKIQIRFTFLVPAHLGSPGKRAVKRVCVRVRVRVCVCDITSLVMHFHFCMNFILFPMLNSEHAFQLVCFPLIYLSWLNYGLFTVVTHH